MVGEHWASGPEGRATRTPRDGSSEPFIAISMYGLGAGARRALDDALHDQELAVSAMTF